eukprot:CAMPEP_0118970050 /NCGR_PEP_ID=MMETSP1173-20130426/7031_1 /TAXON_ID=1034831 /ORGANISM="Rhizochromulina marina cf, Strain CCMP1243" /LENGTH=46 /DNA_ID= /DNA_START= /DNA_END= /DNA_ORIENTATION=
MSMAESSTAASLRVASIHCAVASPEPMMTAAVTDLVASGAVSSSPR